MHYAPHISAHMFPGDARLTLRKAGIVKPQFLPRHAVGAWKNWWDMSVVDPPSTTAQRTHSVGARGRMPGI